ncbi:unnamed protein product [Dovyalis caffra]|uniref:Uncharacterized protein n=1 Tax=Dovyalis caffra TaxID=77055 RepID=A0AAV1RHI8_9ROSI|nr:unnamed protein product [Dovyalis caffra]
MQVAAPAGALYQVHLVRAKTAREFIPKQLKLVEAFGYTLGGFFLASYEDSPVGVFDEVASHLQALVVLAGLVQNFPTPYAWAARVLVSNDDACNHGRKEFGLPSQIGKFSKRMKAIPRQKKSKRSDFLDMTGLSTKLPDPKDYMDVLVNEINGPSATNLCNITLGKPATPRMKLDEWMGPKIKFSLPSFSGLTEYNPALMTYSCDVESRVRLVQPAKIARPFLTRKHIDTDEYVDPNSTEEILNNERKLSISVMLSKPVLALEFNSMKMQVEAPEIVSHTGPTA